MHTGWMSVVRGMPCVPHRTCAALSGAADLDGRQLTGTQASDAALELARSHDWRAIQTHDDIPAKELGLRQGKATQTPSLARGKGASSCAWEKSEVSHAKGEVSE